MRIAIVALALAFLSVDAQAFDPQHLKTLLETNACPNCNLSGVDLSGVDLSGEAPGGSEQPAPHADCTEIEGAQLIGANLERANLRGARLPCADLSGANLRRADLSGAFLAGTEWRGPSVECKQIGGANLSDAILEGADLSESRLQCADLSDAEMNGASLHKAKLTGANLTNAYLKGANGSHAYYRNAKLQKTRLHGADLRSSIFRRADLREAEMPNADLSNSDFRESDLRGARLDGAKLIKTNLLSSKMTRAKLHRADITDADLRDVEMLDGEGLADLTWTDKLPIGITKIRQTFKALGQRERERELTYAIKRIEREETGGAEGVFNYVLFELTSDYGLSPGRPLWILLALIFVFAVPYMFACRRFGAAGAGIWLVWSSDRVVKDEGNDDPEHLTADGLRVPLWALYFSLLSAFHVGWRDLNVGNWIARIQPKEFTLRATGWVRVVSGIQSLISVYLIALWALTYFGRPFE